VKQTSQLAIALVAATLCSACSPGPVRLGEINQWSPGDYDEALEKWSRSAEDYVDLEGRILAHATFLSEDFFAAQVVHRVETERLTRTDVAAITTRAKQMSDGGHVFFMAVHTHEWGWNRLENRPPDGLWRIRVVRPDGEALIPIMIQRLGTEAPEFTPLYPYYRDYFVGYLVQFPKQLEDGSDFLRAEMGSFTLRISGPQGAVDLDWIVQR
jgi:hypothetical protein